MKTPLFRFWERCWRWCRADTRTTQQRQTFRRRASCRGHARDVEAEGEGLVVTTSGPTRTARPDWTRSPRSLTVENRWRAQAPARVAQGPSGDVEQAIGELDNRDRRAGPKEAPRTPPMQRPGCAVLFRLLSLRRAAEIVRLDAIFRQVGSTPLWRWTAAQSDLASMQQDWHAKRTLSRNAYHCSRVGGMPAVVDDIRSVAASHSAAVTAADLPSAEHESENGGERRCIRSTAFRLSAWLSCAADGALVGVQSRCRLRLRPGVRHRNSGGRLRPDPSRHRSYRVHQQVDCGSYERAACTTEAGDNYPGGYCSLEPAVMLKSAPSRHLCRA